MLNILSIRYQIDLIPLKILLSLLQIEEFKNDNIV